MRHSPTTRYHYAESSCAELVLISRTAREYPWHTHAHHWAIGMVCSGTALLGTRKEQRTLLAGGSFTVPPNVAHYLRTTPETTLAVLCLNTTPKREEKSSSLMARLHCSGAMYSLPGEPAPFHLEKLQELALRLAEREGHQHKESARTPCVRAVAVLLQEKPEEVFSLEHLASVAGYSPWHFLRLFQKETGMTPHAYQLVCRLRLLRLLLRAGTAAAEAAVSAGFSDQSHMHRVFKLHHGLTPKEFRRASFRLEP